MERLMGIIVFLFLSGILFGSGLKLIEPSDAIRLIGDKSVLFVSGESNDTYYKNHIVGSIDMPIHRLRHSDDMGNMDCAPFYSCPEEAQAYIRSKGIKNEQMIIAYDNFWGSSATGVISFFESFGHVDLRVLNGSIDDIKALDPNQQVFDKLKAEQEVIGKQVKAVRIANNIDKEKQLENQMNDIRAKMNLLKPNLLVKSGEEEVYEASDYLLDVERFNTHYIADKREVKKAVDDILKNGDQSKFAIIDARSMEEIIGEKKIDNVARGGHIPGATFIEWRNIADMKKKKSFKSLEEMQKIFDKTGITKDKMIYAYCQTGMGCGSHIIAALRLLGYENVKVFTGGWDAWGNDMNLPVRR